MRIRFTTDYQGEFSGPHFYRVGDEVEMGPSAAAKLIADNHAVMVAEAKPKAAEELPKEKPKVTTPRRKRKVTKTNTNE